MLSSIPPGGIVANSEEESPRGPEQPSGTVLVVSPPRHANTLKGGRLRVRDGGNNLGPHEVGERGAVVIHLLEEDKVRETVDDSFARIRSESEACWRTTP